ncbi:MAG: hypothetical protein LC793_17900 [Thermomicrobia bacterium]|nr:hypothetical protein [Thermomicrobia bacterium]MCA1725541.1 hypothetical protein [Thermomicrobia bacterium]
MALKNHAKDFLSIMRMVQVGDLQAQIAQPPLALVVGPDARLAQQFAFALAGAEIPDAEAARRTMTVATPDVLDGLQVGPVPYDVVLLLDPTPAMRHHPVLRRIVSDQRQTAVLAIVTGPGAMMDPGIPSVAVVDPTNGQSLHTLRTRLVPMLHPDRRVAWGRAFAGFRQPLTDYLIEQTARANAQFAIVTDITARIPMVGGFASTGADFFVLTKNQLILAYQLAAIHGRDLSDQKTLLLNAAPYLVAGLGWRELATRTVRVVPGAAFVPKGVIAYGGTVASGLLARTLANPDGVRAWLRGVQEGTKTSLGVGNARMQGVRERFGGLIGAGKERIGGRIPRIPQWKRHPDAHRALESPVHIIPAD